MYILNGAGAHVVARPARRGVARARPADRRVAPRAAWLAMVVVLVIAYYGTIAAVRLGIDPDTYGIPMVSSTVDLVGALTLVVAIATLGLRLTLAPRAHALRTCRALHPSVQPRGRGRCRRAG